MKKYITFILLLTLIVLVGCTNQTSEDETITVVDMVGDTVIVPKNPQKVAVIARAAADMMVGFGLGDQIDGVYYSILDNPWTSVIYPEVSEFHSYDYAESAETFYSRGVDLVLAPEKYLADDLRESGINAITVSLYGNPNYDTYIFYIADLIAQIWPQTASLVNDWKNDFNLAKNAITNVLGDNDIEIRSIYYVRGDKNSGIGYTDTGSSLVETVYQTFFRLDYIGGDFGTNKPSAEAIMDKNPDIVVIGGAYQDQLINSINNDEPYKYLSAVLNNQVFNIPVGFVMWEQNSLALPLFLYDQANKLYPDLFDFDLLDLTKTNFEKYFGIELTDNQVNHMLNGKDSSGNPLKPMDN